MNDLVICASAELVDGGLGVRFTVAGRRGIQREVGAGGTAPGEAAAFVVRYQGQLRAYLNRCAHVPVELDWEQGKFFDYSGLYLICATHGALYAPETGRCVGGRCQGRSLQPLHVAERHGQVFLIEDDGEGKAGG